MYLYNVLKSAVIPASGNKTDSNGFRFDINPDHTHFIIYDDSRRLDRPTEDDLETFDVFRDRIESLLTRSLSYYRRRTTKRCNKNFNSSLKLKINFKLNFFCCCENF